VVALSAHCGEARWRELALQVGCENCLAKPIDFAELGRVLERYLDGDSDSGSMQNEKAA
jgi:hypothetical protein